MTSRQYGALLLLAALWGATYLFMRIASPVLGPVLLIELRMGIAGLGLLGYALSTRKVPDLRRHWRQYAVIGAVNSAVPSLLSSTAALYLPASLMAILNATTPLFGLIVAALWVGEALTLGKVTGLLLGFAGVATLMGLGPVPLTLSTLLASGALLLGALCYGIAAVYTKVKVQVGEPLGLATYSQLFAALFILPVVPFAPPSMAPSLIVTGSVLALALLCTAVAYLLYFYLVVQVGPTRAMMVTYLAPAFGMLWGALFLNESLGLGSFLGFGLLIASVALVNATPRQVVPVRA